MAKQKKNVDKKISFDPAVDYPIVNAVLCVIITLLVPWTFTYVLKTSAAQMLLVQCIVGVAMFIAVTETVGERVGVALSTGPLAGPPFNNPLSVTDSRSSSKAMVKFKAQLWQLIVHVGFVALELKTLADLTRDGHDDWWTKPHLIFAQRDLPALELLYMLQLAVWFVTSFFQVFVFERVSDHLVMLAHHAATILLLGLSYQHGYMGIGLMVLYIHDLADIVVDLLKLSNGLKLEGPPGGFLLEASFVGLLVSWFYYRLYVLPKYIIYQGAFGGMLCAYGCHINNGVVQREMCWDGSVAAERVAQARWARGREDNSSLNLLLGAVMTLLLIVLFLMHVYWFLLFVRIALKLLKGEMGHAVAEQEYEGSDGLATAAAPAQVAAGGK